jgi:hypothetical protein
MGADGTEEWRTWSETWEAVQIHGPDDWSVLASGGALAEARHTFDTVFSHDEARARLAAAAPEMARLLLEILEDPNEVRSPALGVAAQDLDGRIIAVLKKAGLRE